MKKEKLVLWARRIIGAVLVVSYAVAVLAVVRMQLVPLHYVLLAVPLLGVLVAVLAVLNIKKRISAVKGTVVAVLSLLLIVANIYAISVSNATASFLSSLSDDGYTTIEYSILAKKDRNISLASEAKQDVALLQTDTHTTAVKAEMNKKTAANYKEYPELTSLTKALDDNTVAMATIKSSYAQLLKENYNSFYQTVEVLDTFTIKVKKDQAESKTDISKPFVVYISGIDTDGPINSVSRSDVNILAVINPETHEILLVNTPRDYYMQLHGTTGTRDKLTHAGIYGVDMSVNTMEDLYQTDINYYLRINFASLTKLVDALGGVNVYSPQSFSAAGYSFHEGYNMLDGAEALAFSRERYSLENGDKERGANQQRVIEAIIHKLSSPETLGNYQQVLGALEGAFQTNANENEITSLVQQQTNSLRRWNVRSISVDGIGTTAPTYSMGSLPLYVMEPSTESLNAARDEIQQYLQ